jgi:5-methylcytosine-specific restriction endonuclease McrA
VSMRNRRNLRRYVYLRDRGRCWVCGLFVRWENFTIDHVIPKALGGWATRENCRVAHEACNSARGCKTEGFSLLPIFGPPTITGRDEPGFSR